MPIVPAKIRFDDQGNAYSDAFGDIYFNPNDAIGKTRQLFHRATSFDEQVASLRPNQPLAVGELGFGLGLNFLTTWTRFKQSAPKDCRLHYVGLDLAPPSHDQLRQALERFSEWKAEVTQLIEQWPGRVAGVHRLRLDRCELTLHLGGVDQMLAGVSGQMHAWFLDGFAPEKNPDMWSSSVTQRLFQLTRPGGRLGSFTAAGHVRRALAEAGFEVERLPGDPFKRHIVSAQKISGSVDHAHHSSPQNIAVIGAGWAGLRTAAELQRRGHRVTVLDADTPGAGASGNAQAICAPVLDAAASARQDFYRSAFVLASREETPCGVMRLPDTQKNAEALRQAAEVFGSLDHHLAWQDDPAGLWMPTAGVARFAEWAAQLTKGSNPLTVHNGFEVSTLCQAGNGWQLHAADGRTHEADIVVLACASAVGRFSPTADWPLRQIRGQVSHVPGAAHGLESGDRLGREQAKSGNTGVDPLTQPRHAVVGEAYLCPALDGVHSVGATFGPDDFDPSVRTSDHQDNHRRALLTDPHWTGSMDWSRVAGRVGWRCNTPDYLPMIGPVPDLPACREWFATLPGNAIPNANDWPMLPGLFAVTALGAHGVITSALAAPLIADLIDHTPPPCSADAATAVHPARFLTRAAKRRQPIAFPRA